MGILDPTPLQAKLAAPQETAPAAAGPSLAEDFGSGLKSAGYGIRGGLNRVAGTVLEHYGEDGSDRQGAASRDAALAAANAPSIRSYKDVGSVGDAAHYAAGLAGGIVPTAAATVAGTALAGPAGGVAAAGASMLPQELGGQIDRARADPANAFATPGAILASAIPTALASTAVQAIVPGRMMSKGVGAGIRGAAQTIGADAIDQGVAGAAAEGIRQTGDMTLNPDRQYDPKAIAESGAEGAATGAAFGAAHAGAHAVGAAPAAAGGAIGKAKALMPEKAAEPAPATPAEPAAPAAAAPGATPDFGASLGKIFDAGKAKAADMLSKVASGADTAAPELAATSDPAGHAAAIAKDDGDRVEAAKGWLKDLADKVLPQDKRDELAQAAQDLTSKASQMTVAGIKQASDLADVVKAKVSDFAETVEPKAAADTGTKKSEDFSGIRSAITEKVAPILQEHAPEVMSDPKTMGDFADALRHYFATASKPGAIDVNTLLKLTDLTNGHAADVLEALHGAMGNPDDAAGRQTFFGKLNQIHAIEQGHQSLLETMQKNLKPELRDSAKPTDLRAEAATLQKWAETHAKGDKAAPQARLSGKGERVTGLTSEEVMWQDKKVRDHLEARYGDKAEVVLKAVESNMKKERNVLAEADQRHQEEAGQLTKDGEMREGSFDDRKSKAKAYNKDGLLYLHPDHDAKGKESPHGTAADQALARAQRANSGGEVSFKSADELGKEDSAVKATHAMLVREGKITHGLDHKASVERADKEIKKYVGVMAEHDAHETSMHAEDLKKVALDTKNYGTSKSRLDIDGHKIDAVKLTEFMGKRMSGVDDHVPADKDGLARTARMFMEGVSAVTDHLGKSFEIPDGTVIDRKGTTWGQVKAKLKDGSLSMGDHTNLGGGEHATSTELGRKVEKLREQYRAAQKDGSTPAQVEKLAERGMKAAAAYDKAVQSEHMARFLEEHGQQQADPRGPIKRLGENVQPLHTGEDGAPLRKSDTPAPKETRPGPKAVAAKQAAFTEKVRSGDPKTLKALESSTDSKGLQRAVEHLLTQRDKDSPRMSKAIDTINDRLDTLVRNPDVAYGMLTKKYSFQSTVLHHALGRDGFAATHDSPHKFDGSFDWRKHNGKGEGAMAFGAGTYLSSGDKVHEYYKKFFTGEVQDQDARVAKASARIEALKDDGKRDTPEMEAARQEMAAARKAAESVKSPTYHVSVNAHEHEMLNWDKNISHQDPDVREKLEKVIMTADIDAEGLTEGRDGGKMSGRGDLTGAELYRALSEKLGSDAAASDYLQEHGIVGHEYAAANGKDAKAPNYVIYDDSKITNNAVFFSKEAIDQAASHDAAARKETGDYIEKVLGKSVKLAFENLTHAGEFERVFGKDGSVQDIIRLSVHALDPRTVAYHESLHGFFAKLGDAKQGKIMDVLNRAASSASVLTQLHNLLRDEPAALKQLSDPEERAAYMYQFWAQGKLRVGGETHGVFAKIAQFIRSVLGTWSNDQRAQHIMEYFHSGEYAKDMHDPDAVWNSTMTEGRSAALEKAKAMTEPFRQIGESLAVAGGANMRDSGIPALAELANKMKLGTTEQGRDAGYVPVARAERARRMNQLGADLKPYTNAHIAEALEAMQSGTRPATSEARQVRAIVGKRLAEMRGYMQGAGVKVNDMGIHEQYFPRQWNASYIAGHQREFMTMVQKYVDSGQYKGDPKKLLNKLMVTDGAEFNVEVEKPGMQSLKPRDLAFMASADVAPFMKKNLYEIMNSYTTQATRRAEWARRFGDDGAGVKQLLAKAEAQGATPKQLEYAARFVKSVDGTLGDTINPQARRLIGNMLVYQNLRLLPLAIFSSAVDPLGILVRGGTASDAFKTFGRGIKEIGKNFSKDPKSDAATEFAKSMGTIDDAMLVHTLGASYSQGMVGDVGRKINDTFFRLNLMEQFNSSMRVGATEAAMGFLAKHADGKASPHSMRYLTELGLKPGDVKLDADGRPKVSVADGLTPDQAGQMKAAINRWVDGAVLRPDAVDKPVWMSDPHYALIAHLKQFVFSFHETILKRVAHEAQNGNYTPVLALASYVPTMIAADMVKGLIQGGGAQPSWKQDWDVGDYIESGVERGGLLGTGQFAADMLTDASKGGSGVGALLGPTVEQMLDAVKVMGGRERFGQLAIKSMPANALYAAELHSTATDPQFAD